MQMQTSTLCWLASRSRSSRACRARAGSPRGLASRTRGYTYNVRVCTTLAYAMPAWARGKRLRDRAAAGKQVTGWCWCTHVIADGARASSLGLVLVPEQSLSRQTAPIVELAVSQHSYPHSTHTIKLYIYMKSDTSSVNVKLELRLRVIAGYQVLLVCTVHYCKQLRAQSLNARRVDNKYMYLRVWTCRSRRYRRPQCARRGSLPRCPRFVARACRRGVVRRQVW